MKILIGLFTTGMLLTAVPAADVSGAWDLTMRWPGDRQSTGVCTFKQDRQKLTGTCGGADKFPITGAIEDTHLTWHFAVEQGGTKGEMRFTGELDETGKTITGSCAIVDAQQGTFTMVRQP